MKTLKVYSINELFYPDLKQSEIFDHFTDGCEAVNEKGLEKLRVVTELHGWEVKVFAV